ncbi:MAG: hypothetical protein PVI90_08145 [Desulfobacteraceae bacterium]|jgi:hypothetical protein
MKRSFSAIILILYLLFFIGLSLFQGCGPFNSRVRKQTTAQSTMPAAVTNKPCDQDNVAVKDYFETIFKTKNDKHKLSEVLTKFPKGADLHNHLSGAIRPEDYVLLGIWEGDCFGPDPSVDNMLQLRSTNACNTCDSNSKPLMQADTEERQQLLRSLSMYQFNDNKITKIQAGHDQFFATFGRFGAESGKSQNIGIMLVKLLQQAQSENVNYVEIMTSFQSAAVNCLADKLRQKYVNNENYIQPSNYADMFDFLLRIGLKETVAAAQRDVVFYLDSTKSLLNCDTPSENSVCKVEYDFQAAVNRNSSLKDKSADLPKIFTQTALSFLLANTEQEVVGVNLLSGEDLPVSMQTFKTQMNFFKFFHQRFPKVNIALHSGEITPCFVGDHNPALEEHITGSIWAGAKRLGHVVSFTYLDKVQKAKVAELMQQNNVLAEIMFTSNAQILGVTGDEHPFAEYLKTYGVPVAFATDDAGVSYADFTSEWIYAVSQYGLTFREAVRMARASLQYSFLPGESLWQDFASFEVADQCANEMLGSQNPSKPCMAFIRKSKKAERQWDYEAKLSSFMKKYGTSFQKYK